MRKAMPEITMIQMTHAMTNRAHFAFMIQSWELRMWKAVT